MEVSSSKSSLWPQPESRNQDGSVSLGLSYQNQKLRCHCGIKYKFLCHTQPTFSPDELIILSFHYPERTDNLFPINTIKSASNDMAFFQFIISMIQNKCEKKRYWKHRAAGAQDWRPQEVESLFLLLMDSPIPDLWPEPSAWVHLPASTGSCSPVCCTATNCVLISSLPSLPATGKRMIKNNNKPRIIMYCLYSETGLEHCELSTGRSPI